MAISPVILLVCSDITIVSIFCAWYIRFKLHGNAMSRRRLSLVMLQGLVKDIFVLNSSHNKYLQCLMLALK